MGVVKLGDVARESRLKWTKSKQDVPIVGLEHLIPDEIRFDAYDINTDNTFSKRFVKGQVLFGRRRAYQRKAAIAEFDGICSGDITVIEAIEGKIVSELLPFIIQTPVFFDYANRGSAGSLSPRVKWEHLVDYEFELPSLEEQKVLADKLWAAYRLKEAYKKLLVATDEMVKSQFIEMFGNSPQKELGELATFVNGSAFKPEEWSQEGLPIVRIQNLTQGDAPYNYYSGDTSKKVCLNTGDILVSWSATLGVFTWSKGPALLNQHIFKVVFDKLDIEQSFFIYTVKLALEKMADKAHGSTMRHVVKKDFDSTKVSFPSMREQQRFVSIAEQADKSKFDDFKSQFIEMFENVESYCKLEDLISDTFPGEWGSEPISENAIKVIRTTNFTNEGYLDLTDVVTRDIEPKKVVRKKLKQGDTILERSGGTKDNPVGRVVFFDEIGDYLPNNFTQVLRPKESVNPVYLFYALYNSYNLNKAAMRAMASQTTGIQNLSMSDFMAKSIVLPSRDEQNKFEQIYRQADKSKFELKQCIENIDKVIKSLING